MATMSEFAKIYQNTRKKIDPASPECRFLTLLGAGKVAEATALFVSKRQFEDAPCVVDAPSGRYEGPEEIRIFAENWLKSFDASRIDVQPVIQTRACGRAVTELLASIYKGEHLLKQFPMAAVGDLCLEGRLEGLRIYFHYKNSPGFSAYRKPIFSSQHVCVQEPHLMTGAPKAYLTALHQQPTADVERIMTLVGDPFAFGGYVDMGGDSILTDRERLREAYTHMATYIPKWLDIRFETLTDDGITCAIEWVHVITKEGRMEGNRLCESGFAAYERGEDGRLSAIRICDYANCESEIDWSCQTITKKEAERINYLGNQDE